VALALARAAAILDDSGLDAAARAIASEVSRARVIAEHDIMSGRAGLVVALLALRSLLREEALLDVAVEHGDALIGDAQQTDAGLCWFTPMLPRAPGLTGYSHGAGGVATALLELAAATGAERFRDAALAAFAYERALYDPGARNWPDLRSAERESTAGRGSFATFWCHGAPGCALARMRARELGLIGLEPEISAALATTQAWVEAALASATVNYSLCHGLAGNAEVLLEGVEMPPNASSLAQRVAVAGIESYPARSLPWPTGAFGAPTPSLFLGLAGIARFYLRLATPALDSLLVIRPDALPDR
jgi:lantibiotic modifying enzyme